MNKARHQYTRQLVGLLLIALIMAMGMAGANPALHQALHQDSSCASGCGTAPDGDAGESDHSCGVTLLQTGVIFLIDTRILEPLGNILETMDPWHDEVYAVASYSLPQGRAPPIVEIV